MKTGKVSEAVLKRSVMKQIHTKRPEVILGAGIGEDCAALRLSPDEDFVISTDPITGTTQDIGSLGIHITVNDIATMGAEPIAVLLTVLLPMNSEESVLKKIMNEVSICCEQLRVQVVGGHTEVTSAVNQPLVSVTGIGKVKQGTMLKSGGVKPEQDIVVTKWIALEGTAIIAKEQELELQKRLPNHLIETAKEFFRYLSVLPEAKIAAEHGATAMHDITEGGVFGALWEFGEASGVGLDIDLRKIPVRQETIEICEIFQINPYGLISSGSMLIAADNGYHLVEELKKASIPATVIGKATAGNNRLLRNLEEHRFLEPPKVDELYRFHERRI